MLCLYLYNLCNVLCGKKKNVRGAIVRTTIMFIDSGARLYVQAVFDHVLVTCNPE